MPNEPLDEKTKRKLEETIKGIVDVLRENFFDVLLPKITLQEITFVGTYCYTPRDFSESLDLLANGVVSGEGWTEIRPLADGPQSFRDVDQGTAPPKIILAP